MKVKWLDDAKDGMKTIHNYIARDNQLAAYQTLKKIKLTVDLLSQYPHMGRVGRVTGTYELVIKNTAYIVPYRIKRNVIEVLNVFHGAHEWPEGFDDT